MLCRSMDKLAALNAAGVAATVLLAVVSAALAATAAASGRAHPIPMLPQWDALGHTRGEQWEALADVIPVILACYVAHQSLHPLMPLLKPYTQQRMLKVGVGGCLRLYLLTQCCTCVGHFNQRHCQRQCSCSGNITTCNPSAAWRTAAVLLLQSVLKPIHPKKCLPHDW